jgi:XTP/dITP diphosphohydrolase
MKTIYFITGNKGKVHEATEKFYPLGFKIVQKNLGYPEIQTETLEEVARYGVTHIQQQQITHPFILEDAGLFIDVLQGFPGVYSSYVYFTIGLDGIIQLLKDEHNRSAIFRSVFVYAEPSGEPQIFIGECRGMIAKEKKGTKGFGYDPIFIPEGSIKTFAEMETTEKNKLSHRGQSLEKLYQYLKNKQ